MVGQVIAYLFEALVHRLVVVLTDLLGALVDQVCGTEEALRVSRASDEQWQDVQMTACGSLALDVPSLNLRNWSLVS